jgi:AcrR family transcriptional regulator
MDKLLIETARQNFADTGWSGLNIRDICTRAGVNLGMFHYYFKTKEEFGRIVLQEVYEEIFAKLITNIDSQRPAFDNLKSLLITFGKITREYRSFFASLLVDIKKNEPIVLEFVKKNFPRHLTIVRSLILECQKQQIVIDLPVEQIMVFLAGSLLLGSILFSFAETHLEHTPLIGLLHAAVMTDEAILQRIDMALKGISSPL